MLFSDADLDNLSGPHVQRVWFAEVFFPEETRYLHLGMGRLTVGGHTWEGVSDPFGGQLVGISGIEEPEFGKAAVIDISFSGANKPFLASIWNNRRSVEGTVVNFYFCTMNAETGAVLIPIRKVFPAKLTAPVFSIIGSSIRSINVKAISIWEGLNFHVTGSMWSPTGQRQRHPGDKGMDFINSEIIEVYR